jgi:serine/threonine-protein kinase
MGVSVSRKATTREPPLPGLSTLGTPRAQAQGVAAEGDIIANRFRLTRELGRGAMGTVWLAWHLTLEVPCAVKFIVREGASDAAYRARFNVEARATARLHSPHVVRVLDHSLGEDVAPYIAMEFLDGEDLRARLVRVGRLSARATYDVVSQVARGLGHAHAAGIVHRDLKPENIFFAREGEDEVVKILDFGIAKWQARLPTDEPEVLMGTLEYISPEMARGAAGADHRSDLWALSVVAYECLVGRMPFTGESLDAVLATIRAGEVPVPSEVAPHVAPEFDGWWARATSSAIDKRFPSALHLARALGQALGFAEAAPTATLPPPAELPFLLPSDTPSLVAVGGHHAPESRLRFRSNGRARAPMLAAGLLVGIIAGPFAAWVATGHYGAFVARATMEIPHLAAVGRLVTPPDPPTPATQTAPSSATSSSVLAVVAPLPSEPPAADSTARGALPPKVATRAPATRPARAALPNPTAAPSGEAAPKKAALPNKEDAVVDFGI